MTIHSSGYFPVERLAVNPFCSKYNYNLCVSSLDLLPQLGCLCMSLSKLLREFLSFHRILHIHTVSLFIIAKSLNTTFYT